MRALTASRLAPFLIILSLLTAFPVHADDEAIIVNGDVITQDDYQYALAKYREAYTKDFGDTSDMTSQSKIKKELISDLVDKLLYMQEARRRGITAKAFATEEEIDELVTPNSTSTLEAEQARKKAEYTVLSYKFREIIPSKTIAAMKEDITPDDSSVQAEFMNRAEKMTARYIKIDPVEIVNEMSVRDDDLKAYYKQHSRDFTKPSMKKYITFFFDPGDFANRENITPQKTADYYSQHPGDFMTEKLVKVKYVLFRIKDYTRNIYDTGINPREYYEDNIEKFGMPAEVHVRFIQINKPADQAKIKALSAELKQGVSFSALARKYSDDAFTAENGGDLGYVKKGSLKEPYDTIAFSMKSGETSGVIETEKSYGVISVEDRHEEHFESFDDAQGRIEEELLGDAAKPLALTEAKRFKLEARRNGFENAARKKGIEVYETEYFSPSKSDPILGSNNLFMSDAFILASGEVSNEIDNDDSFIVFTVVGTVPSEPLDYSDVEDNIKGRIEEETSWSLAASAADTAKNMWGQGSSVDSIKDRTRGHVSETHLSATLEAPAGCGVVEKKSDGYYLIVPAGSSPSYVPELSEVYSQVAEALATERAAKLAQEKADALLSSGAVTREGVDTGAFSRSDYLIGSEYMKPFIDQCFLLRPGQAGIIKSLGKYYVVKVLDVGVALPGYKDDNTVIKSQVLKEKRIEYVNDWLRKQREKAEIKINI